MKLLEKLLRIAAVVIGYMFIVGPYIMAGGSGTIVMVGWCVFVAPLVYLIWRLA